MNEMLRDGTVPMVQYNEDGNVTISNIDDIILLHEDFFLYDPEKLQGRLDALRKSIVELNERVDETDSVI